MAESKGDKGNGRGWRFLGAGVRISKRVAHGNVVSSEFVKRHWLPLLIAVVMVIIFITSKYQCMTYMEQIKGYERELEVAKTERIRQRALYMSRIRESAMQQMVDSVLPGMGIQEQPPYQLDVNDGQND